jgi:hypothetical protein
VEVRFDGLGPMQKNVRVGDAQVREAYRELAAYARAPENFAPEVRDAIFDPRSQNLNTELGVIVHDEALARAVEASIEADTVPGSSWNAATDDPDQHAPLAKRGKVRLMQWLPIKSLL